MRTSRELTECFFKDLKRYNATNFKTILRADLSKQDPIVHKAFSSVITRYFIFREKHPEVSDIEHRILYFKLKLDMIARYFATYPDTDLSNLVGFQLELKEYVNDHRKDKQVEEDDDEQTSSLPDIELESNNGMPIEQQSESISIAI